MPARILDGNAYRDAILDEVRADAARLAEAGVKPGLAAVLVGENPASQIYVRNKIRACEACGLHSETIRLPETTGEAELLGLVAELNARDEIDGILVQLPLPKQIDEQRILLAIDPRKDVDGFHPVNMGALATGGDGLVPCTPAGVIEILRRGGVEMAGQHAVMLGRSNIVGKPAALLLLKENATVTVCHSRTRDLAAVCAQADILVAAVGRPALVKRDFIRPGATVIDVGINRLTDPAEVASIYSAWPKKMAQFEKKGRVLVGDVDPVAAAELAGARTPVPGGVGPLTIAMLMKNTMRAAELRRG